MVKQHLSFIYSRFVLHQNADGARTATDGMQERRSLESINMDIDGKTLDDLFFLAVVFNKQNPLLPHLTPT